MAEIELELRVQLAVKRPLECRFIELDLPHILGDLAEPLGVQEGGSSLSGRQRGGEVVTGVQPCALPICAACRKTTTRMPLYRTRSSSYTRRPGRTARRPVGRKLSVRSEERLPCMDR